MRFGEADIERAARAVLRKPRGGARVEAAAIHRETEDSYSRICRTVAERAHAALALGSAHGGLRLWWRKAALPPHPAATPGGLAVGWQCPGPGWHHVTFRPHRDTDTFGWLERSDFAVAVWWACRSLPFLSPIVHVVGHDGAITEIPT